jgi:hypothetical protein
MGFGFTRREPPPDSQELARAWGRYFTTCIEAFGAGRCMFESDFPPDKDVCSYTVIWNAFKRIAAGASADEKAALFHDTALRAYRLKLPRRASSGEVDAGSPSDNATNQTADGRKP